MKQRYMIRVGSFLLATVLCLGTVLSSGFGGGNTAQAAAIPAKQAAKSGVTILANDKGAVDASNLAEGYVMVKYTGGKDTKIKVRINKTGTTINYDYDLNKAGNYESFPLTEGNGEYTIKILENTTGNRYAQAHSATVSLTLRDASLPYLYPNQYVNYSASSKVVSTAVTVVSGKTTTLQKVEAVFDYVVDGFTYDNDRAKAVQDGSLTTYLPNVDKVLEAKKGICFDYAAVMSAMLRSQGIPCKLVVGYAGTIYHAWINVYSESAGTIEKVIVFDGTKWTLMDPTFTSSGKRSADIMKYVTNEANYTQRYAY